MYQDYSSDFAQAIEKCGIKAPSHFIPDGKIHRYSTNDNPHDTSGWYAFHGTWGTFGDFRSGIENESWDARIIPKYKSPLPVYRPDPKPKPVIDSSLVQRQLTALWQSATPESAHPYLISKKVKPHNTRVSGTTLLIPGYNQDGGLQTIQQIYWDDKDSGFAKRFKKGTTSKSAFGILGNVDPVGKIFICEGYATAASVHEASGVFTLIAFTAGNLEAVAKLAKAKWPDAHIVIAADDDAHLNETKYGNTGLKNAIRAAQSIGSTYCIPIFDSSRKPKDSDFNDLRDILKINVSLSNEITPPPLPTPVVYTTPATIESRPLSVCREEVPKEIFAAFDKPGTYLHIGAMGLGKTQALLDLPRQRPGSDWRNQPYFSRGQQTVIALPTLEKCDELDDLFAKHQGNGIAMVVRGREAINPKTNVPMCNRHALVKKLQDAGEGNINELLCKNKEGKQCKHYGSCAYIKQKGRMCYTPVHITTHASLFSNQTPMWSDARCVIVDENPQNYSDYHFGINESDIVGQNALGLIVIELKAGRTLLDNTELKTALAQFIATNKEASEASINPDMSDTDISKAIGLLQSKSIPKKLISAAKIGIDMCNGDNKHGLWLGGDVLYCAGKRKMKVAADSIIGLDGTGDPVYFSAITGTPVTVIGTPVDKSDYNVEIVQDNTQSFCKSQWRVDSDGVPEPGIIGKVLTGGYDGIISQKDFITAMSPYLGDTKATHFNAIRGLNSFESCQNILVAGRTEPSCLDVEAKARALFPNEDIVFTGNYAVTENKLRYHTDPYCQLVLNQLRDAEVSQAIARVRPFSSGPKKKVTVWNNIPLEHTFPVTYQHDDTPEPVYRIFGKTAQADVLPLSKHWLSSMGLTNVEIDDVKSHFNQEGNQYKKVEYRVAGSHGGPAKSCVIFTDVSKASIQLSEIHGNKAIELPQFLPGTLTGGVGLLEEYIIKATPPVNVPKEYYGYSVILGTDNCYRLKKKVGTRTETIYVGKVFNPEVAKAKLMAKGIDVGNMEPAQIIEKPTIPLVNTDSPPPVDGGTDLTISNTQAAVALLNASDEPVKKGNLGCVYRIVGKDMHVLSYSGDVLKIITFKQEVDDDCDLPSGNQYPINNKINAVLDAGIELGNLLWSEVDDEVIINDGNCDLTSADDEAIEFIPWYPIDHTRPNNKRGLSIKSEAVSIGSSLIDINTPLQSNPIISEEKFKVPCAECAGFLKNENGPYGRCTLNKRKDSSGACIPTWYNLSRSSGYALRE